MKNVKRGNTVIAHENINTEGGHITEIVEPQNIRVNDIVVFNGKTYTVGTCRSLSSIRYCGFMGYSFMGYRVTEMERVLFKKFKSSRDFFYTLSP